jgi:hypothetical protein
MKKISLLFLLMVFGFYVTGQVTETPVVTDEGNTTSVTVTKSTDSTAVSVDGEKTVTVEKKDTTHIKIGNKGISIYEGSDGTSVKVTDLDKDSDEKDIESKDTDNVLSGDEDKDDKPARKKFKGHWGGLEVGMNNFVNKDFSMTRTGADAFMDLNTGRSWNINLNLMEHGFPLGTDKLGLVTGLGLEFSNYHFDGNNNIRKNSSGIIESYTPIDLDSNSLNLEKTKLATTYLTVPLLLEVQFPNVKPSKRMHISAGIIGGLKIGSHSKVMYMEGGKKQKDKIKDDFNLASLRYGFTARIGYGGLNLYGTYYATSLFEKGKGPELYPFAVGLSLGF